MLHRIQEDSFRSWAQTRRSPSLANGPTLKIGMVFHTYQLLDDLTVRENLDLPPSY